LVRLMPPQAIHDETSYSNTQEMIDRLTSLPRLTRGQERYLDTLSILLEAYEDEHETIDLSKLDPIDVLEELMSGHQMNASDLGRLLGNRQLGPKLLRGERELSKSHIVALARHFHVSPAVFLRTKP
jgi:antitoxin component HigA of HigAB toxin-antitoxin module